MESNQNNWQPKSFINNEWVGHATDDLLTVINKYDQSTIATIPYANKTEVEFAILNSVEAFHQYRQSKAFERYDLLLKIKEALFLERENFINVIVAEAGKPIDYARAEVDRSLMVLEWAAMETMKLKGEVVPIDYGMGVGKTAFTKRVPIGPILAIAPFNFPLNLSLHKIAPALAAGCSVILKPSPYTPLTALLLASLCKKVGLPAGVLNVVICKNQEAEMMLVDDRLKMLSFTGSAEIGWRLKALSSKKKVVLELGGNAAVIVDRTANLDQAAKAIALGAYNFSGQVCISVQKIFVDHSVYDIFLEKFKIAVSELKMGPPGLEGVVVGPLIDRKSLKRLVTWMEEAKKAGANIIFGGEIVDIDRHILAPTLLTNTKEEMKIVCEEVFGPLAIIEKVQYFDEVIRVVNRSRYGLQVGLFTNQISQMKYAHEHLEVGAVIVNGVPGFRVDSMPYGGVKDSGLGREGVAYAIEEMTDARLLVY